ncbi:MAG: DUF1275 domain-containing protein, partial [Akkermansiaceae bacterium]|nr:DUF1275 domain-containing protein [Armatimonadota bacterium]
FDHQTVTHLTGTTSMLAAALARLDKGATLHFAAILLSFFTGTVLSGYIIQDTAFRLGRRYSAALLIESALLCVAVPLLTVNKEWGIYFTSCACGLQNAMVTTYSGTVIRTTHLSGMFTDLGIFLGHAIRGLPVDRHRLRLSLLIISAFFSGGVVGAILFRALEYATLYVPAIIVGSIAVIYALYFFYQKRTTRSCDKNNGQTNQEAIQQSI